MDTNVLLNVNDCYLVSVYSPHEFSSDPSAQSFSPLQNSPRSMQLESPQAKNPS